MLKTWDEVFTEEPPSRSLLGDIRGRIVTRESDPNLFDGETVSDQELVREIRELENRI